MSTFEDIQVQPVCLVAVQLTFQLLRYLVWKLCIFLSNVFFFPTCLYAFLATLSLPIKSGLVFDLNQHREKFAWLPLWRMLFKTTAIFSECPVCTAGRHVFPKFSCAFSPCTLFFEPSCQRDGSGADRDIITIATPSSSSKHTFLLCYYRDSLKRFLGYL